MRVLMHCREDWRNHSGGDVVQTRRWYFWLKELGIDAQLTHEQRPDLTGFDLIHVHNITRAATLKPTIEYARRLGIPVVLTTLYWPADDFERWGRPGRLARLFGSLPRGVRERIKSSVRWWKNPDRRGTLFAEFKRGTTGLMQDVLKLVNAIVVVSHAEEAQLKQFAPELSANIGWVPSGIDADYWSTDADLCRREKMDEADSHSAIIRPTMNTKVAARDGILSIGRFDPQKAQHRLIQAANALQLPLTLIGIENPNYPGYRSYCEKIAGPKVTILPPQERRVLMHYYRQARVHAQASWYELSSLSSLEAAASGCQIVTTSVGGMQDYFGNRAWYVHPHRPEALSETIQQAWDSPVDTALAKHVRQTFTWEQSARRLITFYQAVLHQTDHAERAA